MSNIDEEAKNNFTLEMRIFENYEKVKYYVFFYEVRNGRRIIGKNKIKEILDIFCRINARDVFILWLFVCCVLVCP